eukprot:scaffold992_cov118-Isochrysis_galbana.AAC.2
MTPRTLYAVPPAPRDDRSVGATGDGGTPVHQGGADTASCHSSRSVLGRGAEAPPAYASVAHALGTIGAEALDEVAHKPRRCGPGQPRRWGGCVPIRRRRELRSTGQRGGDPPPRA